MDHHYQPSDMKLVYAVLLVLFCNASAHAQDPQDQQQQKEYVKQIAALQVYIGYAQKGYEIAQKGMTLIHQIKKGDWELHEGYFSSLSSVSPALKKYGRIADIALLQGSIITLVTRQSRQLFSSGLFTPEERSYLEKVVATLLDDCADIIAALSGLTTDGRYQLKTDERLSRIEGLCQRMQSAYQFVRHFTCQNQVLALQRSRELLSNQKLQGLY
jgi:hypothetical protein